MASVCGGGQCAPRPQICRSYVGCMLSGSFCSEKDYINSALTLSDTEVLFFWYPLSFVRRFYSKLGTHLVASRSNPDEVKSRWISILIAATIIVNLGRRRGGRISLFNNSVEYLVRERVYRITWSTWPYVTATLWKWSMLETTKLIPLRGWGELAHDQMGTRGISIS